MDSCDLSAILLLFLLISVYCVMFAASAGNTLFTQVITACYSW